MEAGLAAAAEARTVAEEVVAAGSAGSAVVALVAELAAELGVVPAAAVAAVAAELAVGLAAVAGPELVAAVESTMASTAFAALVA